MRACVRACMRACVRVDGDTAQKDTSGFARLKSWPSGGRPVAFLSNNFLPGLHN